MRLLLISSLLLLGGLFAQEKIGQDAVYRKNGSVLRGVIIEETEKYIRVATQHGVVQIKRSEIDHIERAPTVQEEYQKRLKTTPEDDAQKQFELAQWCKKFGLEGKARYHLFKALLADPEHEPTRIALGYVRYGGRWLPQKQVEKIIEGTDLIIYQGRVMTKEEYEKLQPKEEQPPPSEEEQPPTVEKQPESQEQTKEEKGVPWDKARTVKIGEYTLKTNVARRKASLYRNAVSSIQSNLKTILGPIIKKKKAERTRIWVFSNGDEFSMMTGVRREDGGFWRRDEQLIATYHGAPDDKGGTTGILARMMAYDWVERATERGAVVPVWFVEGLAGYFEAAKFDKNGRCKLGGLPRQAVITLKGLLQTGKLPRVSDLIGAPRARFRDSLKLAAWGLFHFLHRTPKYRRALAQYWQAVKVVSAAHRKDKRFPIPFKLRQGAKKVFTKYFGPIDNLEAAWRTWITRLRIPEEGKVKGNTYTSEKYGFSFTKPSDFSFLKQSPTTGFQVGALKDDARIEVLVLTNTKGYDISGLLKAEKNRLRRIYKDEEIKQEEARCSDAVGFVLSYDDTQRRLPLPSGEPVCFYLNAYFVKGNRIYTILCSCFNVNRAKYEAAFRKVISSFKVGGR